MRRLAVVAAAVLALPLASCGSGHGQSASASDPPDVEHMIEVTSTAFDDGRPIPAKFTCHGAGTSPELTWSRVPPAAGSLALVVDDPDAPGGGYVHWVVMGIPPGSGGTEEGRAPSGAREERGSGGDGWKPPCPPSGTHHYRFTVYAFPSDTAFGVSGDASLKELLEAIADNSIAWGRLTGTVTASGGDSGGGY